MKTKLTLSLLLSFIFYLLSSQTPQGFNYQAIAWDATGKAIANTSIQVRMTIQSDSLAGSTFWIELFSSVTTNTYGMFSVTIGKGAKQTGSLASSFSDIDWRVTPKFIKVEVNYNGWKTMGSARLMTVPYAMSSSTLTGPVKKLAVNGTLTSPDSAIFEVKNNTGQTVFAVYNEGVRAYVQDGIAKGTKGGFAIGGFGTDKAPSQQYMMVSPDSTRLYVKESATKGATKGGFAIGGFDAAKGTTNKFMLLNPKNYFIGHYSGLMTDTSAKYNVTMGYQTAKLLTKGTNNIFLGYQSGLSTTTGSYNVFMGTKSGYSNDTASFNVGIGYLTGYLNKGSNNIFIGTMTGYANTSGYDNIMIGDLAGFFNTAGIKNIFMGAECGWFNSTGSYNIFQGFNSGYYNTTGSYNSMIGYKAGMGNTIGSYNTMLGYKAGLSNTKGYYNTMIGFNAGYSSDTVYSQVLVGYQAGLYNSGGWNTMIGSLAGDSCVSGYYNTYVGLAAGQYCSGRNNVFLGRWAGRFEPVNNNYKLIIEGYYEGSDNYNNALIYGDFSSNYLRVNGNFYSTLTTTYSDSPALTAQHNVTPYYGYGIKGYGGYMGIRGEASLTGSGSRYGVYGYASGGLSNYGIYGSASGGSAYAGYFNGNVYATGTITQLSDKNYKKNILPLSGSLEKVLGLQGVTFEWKTSAELTSLNLAKSDMGKESESQTVNFPSGTQIGVIAQEVEKIVPELVQTDRNGLKSVDYIKIVPLLVEAIKEQQKEIDELKTLVNQLLQAKGK